MRFVINGDLSFGRGGLDLDDGTGALRGAVNGLSAEVIEDHIRNHVVNPDTDQNLERAQSAAELIEVVRTYLK